MLAGKLLDQTHWKKIWRGSKSSSRSHIASNSSIIFKNHGNFTCKTDWQPILKLKHMKCHVNTRKYLFVIDVQKPEQVAQKCCWVSLLGDDVQNKALDNVFCGILLMSVWYRSTKDWDDQSQLFRFDLCCSFNQINRKRIFCFLD